MNGKLNQLFNEIREIEIRIGEELKKNQKKFHYKINKKKIIFEKEAARLQKRLSKSLFRYLLESSIRNTLTAPIIYSLLIPAIIMDLFVTFYQYTCFPVYGIALVRRRDHIIYDRRFLKYLNLIEKLNCQYCAYFNGLTSYVQEIAGRTEQYWCPIKHARKIESRHSRYHRFLDYGDAQAYGNRLTEIRRELQDIKATISNNGETENGKEKRRPSKKGVMKGQTPKR